MILNAKELTEISNRADKRAIEFAKWIDINYICYNGIYNKRTDPYWNSNNKTIEELLATFHKENYINSVNK